MAWLMTMVLVGSVWATSDAGRTEAWQAPITIKLFDSVDVRSERVLLGDVAHITTRDLATLQRLMGLSLGRAPLGGEFKSVSRISLQNWVRHGLRINDQ